MAQLRVGEFELAARARIAAMGDAWASLLDSRDRGARDDAPVAELDRELRSLAEDARGRSLPGVTLLCEKLAELTSVAQRWHYDVPEELFLTVSMGIELLGVLVSGKAEGGADLAGFVTELDAVLRDVRLLPEPEGSPRPPSSRPRKTTASMSPVPALPRLSEHLDRSTRLRMARAATSVFLESLRAQGPAGLRLRESWVVLRDELVAVGHVSLRARLAPHVEQIQMRAAARQKNVSILLDADDAHVPDELAQTLASFVLLLAERAIADGIESPAERARLGKPAAATVRIEGRVGHGKATVSLEDDGSGIDIAAVHRAALAKGLLPAGAPLDERQALTLAFDRRFTAAGGIGNEIDLAAVREAIAREGGSLQVRNTSGRGLALAVLMPDGMTANVRTFRCPTTNVLFAVDPGWAVSDRVGLVDPLDVVGALGLPSRNEISASRSVVFGRGSSVFEVQVRAAPALHSARRLFSPDPESPTEVVLVGDAEAILLRLDLLAKRASQSTVPPPTIRPDIT